jgi:sugar diacid utilization regulator
MNEINEVVMDNNNNNNTNSIRVYLRANLTAQRPITKLARVHRNTQKYYKNKIQNMTV